MLQLQAELRFARDVLGDAVTDDAKCALLALPSAPVQRSRPRGRGRAREWIKAAEEMLLESCADRTGPTSPRKRSADVDKIVSAAMERCQSLFACFKHVRVSLEPDEDEKGGL